MPVSQKQVRWAFANQEGKADGDSKFAKEVVDKVKGKPGSVSTLPESLGAGAGRGRKGYKPGFRVPGIARSSNVPSLPKYGD